ncbi:Flp pilus assembly protein CpaB [Rubellimicrobium aerolatum]|uniref:Flp pilus assembly protein CpaB n=1 Tax=Rubellimicrobium aerolatum TaxID=490979 RepID=A0ABW0SF85_9RHOB|nr:Flp pilus assembly protein CpaB [Rubellimicrobium aerolatum]MBP1807141.1 pilus assembly protein CpaB [Rubellimicrobium aerolatum]
MKGVFAVVLVAGMGLAGTAAQMVRSELRAQADEIARQRAAAAEAVPTVEVYAVARAMAYGETLGPDDVRMIRYAEAFLPAGAFRNEAELFPLGPDVPRVVLRPMEPQEPVLASKVTEPGADAGLPQRLARGMRAFAIRVDATSGVSGFLRPGDRVDVYWTGDAGRAGQVTRLIEPGVRLVAIDQSSDDTATRVGVASNVTVEATPGQVARLAQAQATGDLSLSLVGLADATAAAAIEVDQRALLGLEAPRAVPDAPPVAPPPVCTVRTRKANELSEARVACGAG